MTLNSIPKLSRVKATLLLLLLALPACTKQREAAFPDGTGDDIFQKSDLDGHTFNVKTASSSALRSNADRFRGNGEVARVKVASADTPEQFQPMFKDLQLFAGADQQVPMVFKLDKLYLTAYKSVDAFVALPALEEDLAEESDVAGKKLVPIFQYKLKGYGVVVRTRNALGEETKDLKLKQTDWSQATHIQISTLVSDRITVTAKAEENEQIFVRERLDNRLMSRQDIKAQLGVKVDLPAAESLAYTRLDGNNLMIYEVASFAGLPAEQRRLIRSGPDANRSEVVRCSAVTLNVQDQGARAALPSGDDCVLVLRYTFKAQAVEARRPIDTDGIASSEVKYDETDSRSARLAKIIRDSNPNRVTLAGDGLRPASDDSISIDAVKGKEYFLRRTLQDSPNSFDYTFAGESGNLDIVKFQFERDRVRVVRSKPLLDVSGTNGTDLDTLMSVPATYYKLLTRDPSGNPLANPQYVPASSDEPGAFAQVKWAQNAIANVDSALGYYSLEHCFDGSRVNDVSSIDQRLDSDGVLNFTIDRVYQASRTDDCAGVYRADYWDAVQSTFSFRERFSFKKYDAADENPLFTVPFAAQKKIGMGLFTYKKNVPNQYNNAGTSETELPLGAIYDIRSGKKIKYVLAGLPTDKPALRKSLLLGTRKVIADWNETFRRALKGTKLERNDDVVELSIEGDHDEEGLPAVPAMQLGDLERNYIYNIQKATSSQVIGLGGSHPNPRTGIVQAASVFMYGGNIISYVDTAKKRARVQVEYAKNAKATLTPVEVPAPEPQPHPSAAQAVAFATDVRSADRISAFKIQGFDRADRTASLSVGPADRRALRDFGMSLGNLRDSPELANSAVDQAAAQLRPSDRAFHEAVREAMKQGVLSNARKFESIYLDSQVRNLGGSLPQSQLASLRNMALRQRAVADLYDRMEAAGICVYDTSEAGEMSANDLVALDDISVVTKIWEETLAHELGHNFGLRHNFTGSFDRANFAKDGENAADVKRTYSSVMDYMHGAVNTYDGLGSQDEASIRAAYGLSLELDPSVKVISQGGGQLALDVDGRPVAAVTSSGGKNLVSINDYFKAVRVDSWLNLTSRAMNRLPIKKYLFCTDEDAGQSPTCNRFDKGTTPLEIVQAHLNDYRSLYAQSNFPNDRLSFTSRVSGQYTSRIFGLMLPVRQFLDETFYQLVNPPSMPENLGLDAQQAWQTARKDVVDSYVEAAYAAMNFFEEVIRTPQAPDLKSGIDRWKAFEKTVKVQGADGRPSRMKLSMNVERKFLQDVKMDDTSDRLSARGIEFDKVIATIMLTERHFGFPRYEKDSIAVAFPFFNSLLSRNTKPEELDTIQLLREMMSDHITPAAVAQLENGARPLVYLGSNFEAPTTQMLRFYAVLGGIVNLDLDGLEQRNNFSNLFRVLNGFTVPAGKTSLAESGADASSGGTLKYWAYDQGETAKSMINDVHALDELQAPVSAVASSTERAVSRSASIKVGMGKWLAKKVELDAAIEAAPPSAPGQQPRGFAQVAAFFREGAQRAGLAPMDTGVVPSPEPSAAPSIRPSSEPSAEPVPVPSSRASAEPVVVVIEDPVTVLKRELLGIEAEVNAVFAQVPGSDTPRIVAERNVQGEIVGGLGDLMQNVYDQGHAIAAKRMRLGTANARNVQARIQAISHEARSQEEQQALIAALQGINTEGAQIKSFLIGVANQEDLMATQLRNIGKDDAVVEAVLSGIPVPKFTDPGDAGHALTPQELSDNASNEAYGAILPAGQNRSRRGVEFSSIQKLNEIFFQLHREFAR